MVLQHKQFDITLHDFEIEILHKALNEYIQLLDKQSDYVKDQAKYNKTKVAYLRSELSNLVGVCYCGQESSNIERYKEWENKNK